jgi:hypothetical protein
MANAIVDPVTGESMEYRQLIKKEETRTLWTKSFANELGRLAQGIPDVPGTDTIKFIRNEDVPQ